MVVKRTLFAAISTACRFALASALILAMLVPHTGGAAIEHHPVMTMSAASNAPMHDHSGKGHGVFGGFACAVVCFGAPVTDGPFSPIPVIRVTTARYSVGLPKPVDMATPDPAFRPPERLRTA